MRRRTLRASRLVPRAVLHRPLHPGCGGPQACARPRRPARRGRALRRPHGACFGPRRRSERDRHPVVEMALVELYRETGTARHLDLAAFFCDQVPWQSWDRLWGHAVCALYFACGLTDVAIETGDETRIDAVRRWWAIWVDRDLRHRRGRRSVDRRGRRRALRAAVGALVHRDVRRGRRGAVARPDAPARRRRPRRRRARAGAPQRAARRRVARRRRVVLRQSARHDLPSGGAPVDRRGAPRADCRAVAVAPRAVARCHLLPAERHPRARHSARPALRHRRPGRRLGASVRVVAASAPATSSSRSTPRCPGPVG